MGQKATRSTRATPKRLGGVQRTFVGARAVSDDVLCISAPTGGTSYVGVLEVGGITYDLKSDAEQVRLNELYQTLLCGLTYEVQVLWRSLPLRLEPYVRGYLDPYVDHLANAGGETIWGALAADHAQFLQTLATRRTLLERRIYVIVRVSETQRTSTQGGNHSLLGTKRLTGARALEWARQELSLRLAEITRRLELLQLSTRRLTGVLELARFYQSCLQPIQAARYPLQEAVVAGIDRPTVSTQHNPSTEPAWSQEPASNTKHLRSPRKTLFTQLADLVAPDSIEVTPDYLKVGEEYHRLLAVTGLPRTVAPGWLRALMEFDEPFDLCFHIRPQNSVVMDRLFRQKQTLVQANRLLSAKSGDVMDAQMRVAQDDLEELSYKVTSGAERMLDVFWFVRVWGTSKRELNERTQRVQNVLYSSLVANRLCSYEQAEAYRSCLPHARVHVQGEGLLLSGEATSTTFPFVAASFFHEEGLLEGVTPTGELIVLDPWSVSHNVMNANRVVFGPPGQGKSYYVKTSIIRMAAKQYLRQLRGEGLGFQIFVVDPDREYGRMAAALGGQIIRLAPGSADRINPFDLPQVYRDRFSGHELAGDSLSDHIQRLHALLEIMCANRRQDGTPGLLTEEEDSLLDLALYATYQEAGITRDPSTHQLTAPLMRDLVKVLQGGTCGEDKTGLVPRLRRFTEGSLSGLFSGPTTLRLDSPLVVFDTNDCETELQQIIALFLVSNYVWSQAFQGTIPRQLIVDEAASLVQYPSGKRFLEDLTRRARKNYLGVTTITQHPSTFADSTLVANSAIKVLMRPDPTSLDLIKGLFKLSDREAQRIQRLRIGEGLMLVADQRMIVQFITSDLEHILATTNPREIAEWMEKPEHAHLRALLQRLSSGTSSLLELAEARRE
jgi:hypothetical protein